MALVFSRGISVPGGLENATDAVLFRVATKAAKNEAEIDQLDRELKKLRAEAKRDAAALKRTQGAVVGQTASPGRAGTMQKVRVSASAQGIKAGGVSLRNGKFSISARSMRMGTGAYIVMGAIGMIGGALKQWREGEEIRKRYGGQELVGRLAQQAVKAPFVSGAELARGLVGEAVGFIGGDSARAKYRQKGEQLDDFLLGIFSPAEAIERKIAREQQRKRAYRESDALVTSELEAIQQWKPDNFQFRTSADIAAARRAIIDRDRAAILADSTALRDEILANAGIIAEAS